MSTFGYELLPYVVTFLLTCLMWVRIMRSLFDWLGIGPR